MAQNGWHVNVDNCIACRACEGACKQEFDLPVGVRRRRVLVDEGVAGGAPYKRHLSLACNHCAKPACLRACPVGRYWKDDSTYSQPGTDVAALRTHFGMTGAETGLVLMKPTEAESAALGVDCIGCKRCQAACPYGAPQFDETTEQMDKCTGCFHRWAAVPATSTLPMARRKPACVVSCTALALSFGDMAGVMTWAQRRAGAPVTADTWGGTPPAGGKEIADPLRTAPSIRFTPQRNIP